MNTVGLVETLYWQNRDGSHQGAVRYVPGQIVPYFVPKTETIETCRYYASADPFALARLVFFEVGAIAEMLNRFGGDPNHPGVSSFLHCHPVGHYVVYRDGSIGLAIEHSVRTGRTAATIFGHLLKRLAPGTQAAYYMEVMDNG